jgi:hypothetical protein
MAGYITKKIKPNYGEKPVCQIGRRSKNRMTFDPDRKQCSEAVKEYLGKKGNKITRIKIIEGRDTILPYRSADTQFQEVA